MVRTILRDTLFDPSAQNSIDQKTAYGESVIKFSELFVTTLSFQVSFSSPEAGLLLVSTKNRNLWLGPKLEVHDSQTSRHSAHTQI